MNTLLIGATGTIGKEILKLSRERGDNVIAASRKSTPSINIDDPASIDKFFNEIPPLDAIICAAGNASFGKLEAMQEEDIRLGLHSKLLGQVYVVKKGLQKLKSGGAIILTGGMLAYAPWPETSNIAMVNAGLEGFVRAVAMEADQNKRVLIVHPPLLKETAEMMGMDGKPWPSASKVAKTYIVNLDNQSSGNPIFVDGYEPG